MIYSFRDIERVGLKLVILCHFLPFYSPKNLKNQDFEKWKKLLEISSFCTCVPKTTIIWLAVLRIQSKDKFINILDHFLPFYHWNNPDNQNFEKMKNILEILSFYTFSPSMNMTYSMVPVMSDIILCHFWELITYLPH